MIGLFWGKEVEINGIVEKVEDKAPQQQVILLPIAINNHVVANNEKILAKVPYYPSLFYGDQILLKCELRQPMPFDGFRYDIFLAAKKVFATCVSYQSPTIIAAGKGSYIKRKILQIRALVINKINKI
ncbi:hypothetical protein D6827_02620, partial [Candidatus Parcubacteria bacterium]